MIEGKRNQGIQRKCWCYNIHQWSHMDINKLNSTTKDRSQWKMLSHVSAQYAIAIAKYDDDDLTDQNLIT